MVEIECLECGETLKIPQFVNTDNYDGQVVCQKCNTLLHIKLVQSEVRKYWVVEKGAKRISDITVKLAMPPYDESLRLVKETEEEPKQLNES